jgi:hypothetical protein
VPTRFRRDGFDYQQIAREGDAAIYEQRWAGCCNPSVCYEVIRIRRREGFRIDDRFVEPAEVYPNSDVWGVDGFTLTDRDAAVAKLREICIRARVGVAQDAPEADGSINTAGSTNERE